MIDINNFLDDNGKIKIWPAKPAKKKAVLYYLSSRFEPKRTYSEQEINAIIEKWHTFNDLFILRRGMIDMKFMFRTKDGSQYWRANMFALDIDGYKQTKEMFNQIPGCAVCYDAIENNKQEGKIFVDDLYHPKAAYLETFYGFHYFLGEFNKPFFMEVINYIFKNVLPNQTLHNYIFAFGSDDMWLCEIEKALCPYNGFRTNRRLYYLNPDLYHRVDKYPENYKFGLKVENDIICAVATYNGTEVACCKGASHRLSIMDLDIFVHENHRRKGVAQVVFSMTVDYCLAHKITPQCGIWSMNIPSWSLAEKMGFKKTVEFEAYVAEVKQDEHNNIN